MNRTDVPVSFFAQVPMISISDDFSPPVKPMRCIWPPRRTVTSSMLDRAFTTETPTPCKPPENW